MSISNIDLLVSLVRLQFQVFRTEKNSCHRAPQGMVPFLRMLQRTVATPATRKFSYMDRPSLLQNVDRMSSFSDCYFEDTRHRDLVLHSNLCPGLIDSCDLSGTPHMKRTSSSERHPVQGTCVSWLACLCCNQSFFTHFHRSSLLAGLCLYAVLYAVCSDKIS